MNLEKKAMFRVAIQSTPDVDTWILQGRLAGPIVDELTMSWKNTRGDRRGRHCVIDLVDITSVDTEGEIALMEMMREGAQFVVRGVYTKVLLENLRERYKREA